MTNDLNNGPRPHRKKRMGVVTGVAIGMIWGMSTLIHATPSLNTATKNSVDIQKELQKNTAIIYKKKKQERSILNELGELKTSIYLTQKRLNKAYRDYNQYIQKIQETQAHLTKENKKLAHTKQFLNHKILDHYKNNTPPIITLIFGSDSFSSWMNTLYFYEKIIKRDYQKILEAKKNIETLKKINRQLNENKQKANQLRRSIVNKRSILRTKRSTYQNNLAALRSEREAYEKRNQVLRKESQQLSRYIESISGESRQYLGSGSYVRPAGGYISSVFGMRRHPIFKRRRMHNGIDFAAPKGYRIKATDSGQVIFSGFKRGYGNVTIINHGWYNNKKISSLYAHQWKILVKKGDIVRRGQLIGYVGSTGYSTGPHLHFEIRENGKPVNPRRYLKL